MSFTHDDVQRLIQLLDSSQFDELQLETQGLRLLLRRNGVTSSVQQADADSPRVVARPRAVDAPPPAAAAASSPVADPTLLEVRAPMLGTFYSAPKPGADPFVAIGGRVSAQGPIGIIEVMKLMNSITAGVDGVLEEVLVRDGELVEYDQVIMRVRAA